MDDFLQEEQLPSVEDYIEKEEEEVIEEQVEEERRKKNYYLLFIFYPTRPAPY